MKAAKLDHQLEELGIGIYSSSTERPKVLKSAEKPKTYNHGVASWEKAAKDSIARKDEFEKILEEKTEKRV